MLWVDLKVVSGVVIYCPIKIPHVVRDINRLRLNWVIMCFVTYLIGILNYITGPSLHQFVTSSSNSSDPQVT